VPTFETAFASVYHTVPYPSSAKACAIAMNGAWHESPRPQIFTGSDPTGTSAAAWSALVLYGVPYLKGCFHPSVFSAYDTSF
jgi:hypothetical protein